jgi:antitoxin (DNA-binding transcriptional repressor) of toxin-antitoxin stability system
VSESHAIGQRDLCTHAREILNAVEHGESFTITRGGRAIAELVPSRSQRQFVPTDELLGMGRGLAVIDPVRMQADIDGHVDPLPDDTSAR